MRVLVAEDDRRIRDDLVAALEATGYVPVVSGDGEDIWFRGDTEDFGAVILDLGLPGMDGLSILKRWRAAGRRFPVLVLTARGSWSERVVGIDAGADDYLPKPFEMDELLARLRAILRRTGGHAGPELAIGDLVIDPRQMRVTVAGVPVALSPQEYRLVTYLAHNAGRVISQQELAEHLHADHYERESNAVEVLVGRARRKLGGDYIQTRRGFGYLIEAARE
jgi:two-component system, OmpR family, response regulator